MTLQYGRVTGRLTWPDSTAVPSKVTFIARPRRLISADDDVIVFPRPVPARLDSEGNLIGADDQVGVSLMANNSPGYLPEDWTWSARIEAEGRPMWTFDFAVTAGSEQDLSEVSPIEPSGGSTGEGGRGPKGDKGDPGPPGKDGIMASIVPGDGITVDDTDPANPVVSAPAEITVDTSVGTRVFAGGQMIYGDTDWRDITTDLKGDWSATTVRLARVGSDVMLSVDALAGTASIALTLPTGFRGPVARADLLVPAQQGINNAGPGKVYPQSNGNVWVSTMTGAQFMCRWATSDPWPTTLPGTPA